MMVENAKVVDVMPNYSTSLGYVDDMAMMDTMGYENSQSEGLSTEIILYIVIGVSAVIGIVLGIIMGKRAANK